MEPPQLQRATSSSNSADFSQYEEPEMMTRDHSFDQTCYSEAEVKAAYDRKVEDVSCMLKIAKSMARFLLARTRPPWDVEKAVETWFDEGLRSRLLGEQSRVQGDASESCLICGCLGDIVFTLTCGHAGCAECFTNFIRSQLSQRRFPPYTCKQICGRECHGVFDCEVADLPLDEADRAMISSSEATLEGEIMPFRSAVLTTAWPADKKRAFTRPPSQYLACFWPSARVMPHAFPGCASPLPPGVRRRHFPVPCKYAFMWLTNYILPMADAIEQEAVTATRRSRERERERSVMNRLNHVAGRGERYRLDELEYMMSWCSILNLDHRVGLRQHLLHLTAAQLLAGVPPAVGSTLRELGFEEAAAAELARMQHPLVPPPPEPLEPAARVASPEPLEPPPPPLQLEHDAAVSTQCHKLCPGCLRPVKLEGFGCNSTACPECRTPFCYICLRTDCVVVRSHGACPQGGIDVASFLAAARARNPTIAPAAADDIAALANYEPDVQERERLQHRQIRDRPNPRFIVRNFHMCAPAHSHLQCLERALAAIGFGDFDHHRFIERWFIDEVFRRQQLHQAECDSQLKRVSAIFVATSLNLSDLELLPKLEETHTAWEAIRKRSKELVSVEEALSDLSQVLMTLQEALRLEQWLLADAWLSQTGRVRGHGVSMITFRREMMSDLIQSLSDVLLKVAKERAEGSSSNSTNPSTDTQMICDLHKSLGDHLQEQLKQLHAAFGAGAAMNTRVRARRIHGAVRSESDFVRAAAHTSLRGAQLCIHCKLRLFFLIQPQNQRAEKERQLNNRLRLGSLADALTEKGFSVVPIDLAVGGAKHDMRDPVVVSGILSQDAAGEFSIVWIATPCESFSVLWMENGRPKLRLRRHPHEWQAPMRWQAYLRKHNELVAVSAELARATYDTGGTFVIENPVDRGDTTSVHFKERYADHAPLWVMPHIVRLASATKPRWASMPMCAFNGEFQKWTTLMAAGPAENSISVLGGLPCTHLSHTMTARGTDERGVPLSEKAGEYPALFAATAAALLDGSSPTIGELQAALGGPAATLLHTTIRIQAEANERAAREFTSKQEGMVIPTSNTGSQGGTAANKWQATPELIPRSWPEADLLPTIFAAKKDAALRYVSRRRADPETPEELARRPLPQPAAPPRLEKPEPRGRVEWPAGAPARAIKIDQLFYAGVYQRIQEAIRRIAEAMAAAAREMREKPGSHADGEVSFPAGKAEVFKQQESQLEWARQCLWDASDPSDCVPMQPNGVDGKEFF
ncbi:MAG: hypothetical protein SGPRY_010673 [Prymnesium sp.]